MDHCNQCTGGGRPFEPYPTSYSNQDYIRNYWMRNRNVYGLNIPLKMEWPEVVGLAVKEAERKVKEDMPEAQVEVIAPTWTYIDGAQRQGWSFSQELNLVRVRLVVDVAGIVIQTPRFG